MVDRIILFAMRQKLFVGIGVTALIVGGILTASKLPIDAVPDITSNQVQVFTVAPALAPQEIERLVTYPLEVSLQNLPDVEEVRSVSKFGLSAITVVFDDHVDIYFARQLVAQRLQEAKDALPPGIPEPEMGPVSTGLGEIYQYEIVGEGYTPMELRTIQDWIIKRQLAGTRGLAEVNTFGGELKQYQVLIDPQKLLKYDLGLRDVIEAVSSNNANAPGAYIEHKQEQYVVVGIGVAKTMQDIESIIVKSEDGTPIFVRDVAQVSTGSAIRQGAVTINGTSEIVSGIAMMLQGENAREVVARVKERMAQIQKTLPSGVKIVPFYDRTELVSRTIRTVITNLTEGALLVILILFLLLMNLRGGFIVASVIPLSMLFAVIMMKLTGVSGNLMSLGAIDFGIIVDGAVVLVENALRKLHERQQETGLTETTEQTLLGSFLEVGRPILFGVAIIIIVYLPILSLQGIEGKMFRPMAYTVVFALTGALFLTLTYVPVVSTFLFKKKISEKESPIIRWLKPKYHKTLLLVLHHRKAVLGSALALFAGAVLLFARLGGVFIPTLDEGDILIELRRIPSISLTEAIHTAQMLEAELKSIPEVVHVVSKTGRPEIANDPMSIYQSDVYIRMKPREEWGLVKTKEEMIARMTEVMNRIPGIGGGFSQPIEMRFNELIAGIRSDVGVKIFGEDLEILARSGEEIARILQSIPGSADVRVQQVEGLPQLQIVVDRDKIARHGINVSDVNILIQTALAGTEVGRIYEGERQFDLVVKFQREFRNDIESLKNLLVPAPHAQRVRLGDIAAFELIEGPAEITHSAGRRYLVVESNVRERDIESFVNDVKAAISQKVKLPVGYTITYGGEFENLERARDRLAVVVPIALFLIFLLLFMSVNSIRQALIIFSAIPLAVIGGVVALWIRDMPFSISAGVGFIALFGVAVLNGLVMLSYYNKLLKEGMDVRDAVIKGSETRLRPVLTTALVASLGFIPMAVSTSAGAEVQRPLATVVIGGLITSTLLTLVVLPVIFDWLGRGFKEKVP
ncbi:MAG TPA: CusA/CzcA family heavy metal efflux RND transporter [Bacteroidota bacterium]|nr:CusA/CzcA family heavy metal efflux RND transporter [Bacteroidota bacterium]